METFNLRDLKIFLNGHDEYLLSNFLENSIAGRNNDVCVCWDDVYERLIFIILENRVQGLTLTWREHERHFLVHSNIIAQHVWLHVTRPGSM